jgi:hypothetical protein
MCNCKKKVREAPKVITSIPTPTPDKEVEEPKEEN